MFVWFLVLAVAAILWGIYEIVGGAYDYAQARVVSIWDDLDCVEPRRPS